MVLGYDISRWIKNKRIRERKNQTDDKKWKHGELRRR
jgi:hypothetical protein